MISLSEILHTIAQALMIPCLIILLILMAGAVWQIGDIVVEYIAERRKHKCNVPQLLRDVHAAGADGLAELIENSGLLRRQKKALLELAEQGPAVFLGRCGNYVLRDRPDCIHLFICGSAQARIRRAVEVYGLKEKDAAHEIQRIDKLRASYYSTNTGHRWGYGETYDLIINTDQIGVEGAVKLIKEYMALRG